MAWEIGAFILSRVDALVQFLFLVLWDSLVAVIAPLGLWPLLGGVALVGVVAARRWRRV